MPPGSTHHVPGDFEDFPFPSGRWRAYSSPSPSAGVNLSTALLSLFGHGAFSFWQWRPSNNELTTFGSLGADSLEDWMTRIHPRDQAEFSAFIDQLGEEKEPDTSIEYRFCSNRHGEWIRVRQTAHFPGQGSCHDENTGSLICLIEKLDPQEFRSSIDGLEEQIRSNGAQTGEAWPKFLGGLIGAESFAPRLRNPGQDPDDDEIQSRRTEAVLPALQRTAARPAVEKRALEEKGLKGSTILLVEDEAAVRKLVRKLLEMLGCKVIESTSGRQALSLWPEIRDQVSLVVSDIVMPGGISGWDLAKELHHRHPALPILLTSGYSEFAEDHDIIDHPRIAFLQKPYQIKSLRNMLCRLTREAVSCSPKEPPGD